MKKCALFLFLLFIINGYCQCDIKTTNRPDGVTMKYFTPKPVARAVKHEAGLSLYYNVQAKQYTLSIFVLHKEANPKVLEGNLVIQTTNTIGISLEPYLHKMIEMNGQDVSTSIYYLEQRDVDELKNYPLKTLAFTIDGEIVGLTVTENSNLLQSEFDCLNSIVQSSKSNTSDDDKFLQELDKEYYEKKLLDSIAQTYEYKKWATENNVRLARQNAFDFEQHQIDFDSSVQGEAYTDNIMYEEKSWYNLSDDTITKIIGVIIYLGLAALILYGFKK